MKFLLKVIIIAGLTYLLAMYFPWWSVGAAAFIGGLILKTKTFNSFLAGALGVGLLWLVFALKTDIASGAVLSNKMSALIGIDNKNLLIMITVLIGSLVGALSALTGDSFRKLFEKKKRSGYYT